MYNEFVKVKKRMQRQIDKISYFFFFFFLARLRGQFVFAKKI
jgi:hypothetical protein